jgi:phosphoglycerate dehydrogenase-like enzyme
MPKVLMFTNLAPENVSELVGVAPPGFETDVYPTALADAEKAALVEDADFVILFPPVLSNDVLRAATRLRLIQLVSAGFDKMDVELCRELGIPIANNGGANSIDVAEHAVMLMLACYRRLCEMDANVRTGGWRAIDSGIQTFALHGKTVGIVGLGNIGRRVAQLLRPFGVELVYADAFEAPAEVERELGVQRLPLDEMLRAADIVTLHVPLNDATRSLIGARELGIMKPSAVLINTCRGPVVDEHALAQALQTGVIAGAGLDVLDAEPPDDDNPLLGLANVILTPHTAGVTHDTWERRGRFIFENLQRVWEGEPALAVIS